MVVVERLGRSVTSFTRVADLEEGMEANLRATVVSISPAGAFFWGAPGVGPVPAYGSDAANGGVALLAVAMFLLVFSVLVFVPRLARRGPASFSFYSRRSLDEAVKAVREAIEASGRTPRVDIVKSRSERPPRIVTAEGIQARFRIEVTRHAAGSARGREWTDIVASSASRDGAEAQALRKKVMERLADRAPAHGCR